MSHLRERLAVLTIAAGGLLALGEAYGIVEAREADASPLMIAVGTVVLLATILALGLTCAPGNVWDRLHALRSAWWQSVCSRKPTGRPRLGRWLAVIGCALWAVLILWSWQQNAQPVEDQVAYLQTARQVHDAGGPGRLLHDLFSGDFAEANRHPLYIGLLSLRPTHTFGRTLSATFGLLTLIGSVIWMARRRGWFAAGILALLLGTNGALLKFSTQTVCETLMIGLTALLWGIVSSEPMSRSERTLRWPRIACWLVVGVTGGLLWLTKGTGLLLFGLLIMCLLHDAWLSHRRRTRQSSEVNDRPKSGDPGCGFIGSMALRTVPVACVVIGFAVIASPLISRNMQRFSTPFYNVNSQLLFVDAYEDPQRLADRHSTGDAAARYWETHPLDEMIAREAQGLIWEAYIIARSLGPAPLDDARILFGLPLLVLALIEMCARRDPGARLLAYWLAGSWLIFAWYVPIAAGERFVTPLLVPLLAEAACGIRRVGSRSVDST